MASRAYMENSRFLDELVGVSITEKQFNKLKPKKIMQVTLREDFEILEDGVSYVLPMYDVVEEQGIVRVKDTGEDNDPFQNQIISFVRGSKVGTEDVPKRRGTLHEHILAAMIHDLEFKNKLVPSKETTVIITKLQEALHWFRERSIKRASAGVQGTYQK